MFEKFPKLFFRSAQFFFSALCLFGGLPLILSGVVGVCHLHIAPRLDLPKRASSYSDNLLLVSACITETSNATAPPVSDKEAKLFAQKKIFGSDRNRTCNRSRRLLRPRQVQRPDGKGGWCRRSQRVCQA